jgi:hypothetical protein
VLTWKEIKASIENDHPEHKVKNDDLLTYVIVHFNTVAFGIVGDDGVAAHINHHTLKPTEFQTLPAGSASSRLPQTA